MAYRPIKNNKRKSVVGYTKKVVGKTKTLDIIIKNYIEINRLKSKFVKNQKLVLSFKLGVIFDKPDILNNTKLTELPSIPAVYLLTNKYKRILYIGSAQNLRQRWFYNYRKNNGATNIKIRDYLKQNACLTNKHYLYYCELKSNIEAKTIESLLIGIIETELNSEWQ